MKSCVIHPRSSDVSDVLTEVRTVLSRSESALRTIENDMRRDGETKRDYTHGYGKPPVEYAYAADPDAGRIRERMQIVIAELDHWRKCGSDCPGRKA